MLDVLGEKKDVPIVLESISFEDNYTEDYLTRREIVYTLNFTAKTYMYGPHLLLMRVSLRRFRLIT